MTPDKTIYLFANWKMYLNYSESLVLAEELAEAGEHFPDNVKMAVFPPTIALAAVSDSLATSKILVGSQNIHWVERGGYTGEISAAMVKEVGASYVLIGHSERRHMFRESNHEVRQKIEAALAAGLTPVLCVGETKAEREAGETKEVIEAQIRAAFFELNWPAETEAIIAYEPVWAISRGQGLPGEHCTAIEAEPAHRQIRQWAGGLISAPIKILFGGSVRPQTIREYITNSEIDGVLVGAASTQRESWFGILEGASA